MSFQIDKAELFHVSNFFHNPTSSQSNYFNKKLEKKNNPIIVTYQL